MLLFTMLCIALHFSNAQIPLVNENHYEDFKIEHEITSLLNEAHQQFSVDSLQIAFNLTKQAYNNADSIDFYEGLWPACTLIAQLHLEKKEYHHALYYILKAAEIGRVMDNPAKTNQNLLFLDTLLYDANAKGVHLDSHMKLYQQNISKYYAIKQKGEKRLLVTILISVVVLIIISVLLGIIIRYGERASQALAQTKHLHYKQSVFLSILAHDLKNLVIGLRNNIDNLRNENKLVENNYFKSKFDLAKNQVSESKLLLENVLRMAQPDDFELHPDYALLSVKQLFNKMYLHEIEAREKKLELIFKYDYDFNFNADPVMIESVLRNLITNAIQNTSKGIITVCAKEESREFKFSVIDTGCGIKQELQNQLFSYRIKHSSDKDAKVSGFGLMVSKKLITAHRGTIDFSSNNESGSTFWFTIPKKI